MKKKISIFTLSKIQLFIFICFSLMFSSTAFSQVQTQTKRPNVFIHTNINGFLESLPVSYTTETTKKFPLIISLHRASQVGDGSSLALDTVKGRGIPQLIEAGVFPSSFTVREKKYSFIVISPQLRRGGAPIDSSQVKSLIDYCVANYRVDTQRIYLTGMSMGGKFAWIHAGATQSYADRLAALLMISPSIVSPYSIPANNVAASDLPVWTTGNYIDGTISRSTLKKMTDSINSHSPDPLAKLSILDTAGVKPDSTDAWTETYDTSFRRDGLNVYEWMLSYNNKLISADAGPDQPITLPGNSTITLNGTRSRARRGTISTYAWTKISGPASGTITSASAATTTVTGIAAGTYLFRLVVTHSGGSTDSDTVLVSTQTQTQRPNVIIHSNIHGYLESLPVTYAADTSKKFPLLIFIHGSGELGNGLAPALLKLDTANAIPKMIYKGKFPALVTLGGEQFSFIVISPQLISGGTTAFNDSSQINNVIDYCINNYRVDRQRIYLTGISMGGKFGWNYIIGAQIYADRLAASLLVSASVVGAQINNKAKNVDSTSLPMWFTVNLSDTLTSGTPAKLQLLVNKINSYGPVPPAKFTVLDSAKVRGHDAWTETYDPTFKRDNLNVYEWMLSYKRNDISPRIVKLPDPSKHEVENNTLILDAILTPNPVRNDITVWLSGKAKGKSNMVLYTFNGQRLAQQQFVKNADEKTSRTFNVSRYQAGTYIIQVTVGNQHKRTLQFIKQ